MFAPIILPFKITLILLCVVFFGLQIRHQQSSQKRSVPGRSIGAVILLFIPILFLVGWVVDTVRYGEFGYETAADIRDRYIQVPSDSRDLTVYKYASGHEIKFVVSEELLHQWMKELTAERFETMREAKPFELQRPYPGRSAYFDRCFRNAGWMCPPDVVQYKGWHSGRGSGFDVWYAPSTETAYIDAAYW